MEVTHFKDKENAALHLGSLENISLLCNLASECRNMFTLGDFLQTGADPFSGKTVKMQWLKAEYSSRSQV